MATSKTKVFGVHLSKVMSRSNERTYPNIVRAILRYFESPKALKDPSIFKLERLEKYKETLQKLKRIADRDMSQLNLSQYPPDVVSCLLMLYLKELPDPLIPFILYDRFINAARQLSIDQLEYVKELNAQHFDEEERRRNLEDWLKVHREPVFLNIQKHVISKLPDPNRVLLGVLLVFFAKVCCYESFNHITTTTLSQNVAALIFRQKPPSLTVNNFGAASPRKRTPRCDTEETPTPEDHLTKICLMELLIDLQKELFKYHQITLSQANRVRDRSDDVTAKICEVTAELDLLTKELKAIQTRIQSENNPNKLLAMGRKLREAKQALRGYGTWSMFLSTEVGVSSVQGQRQSMEDTFKIVQDLFADAKFKTGPDQEWDNFSFYGVYDGHNGDGAAKYLEDNLHKFLIKQPLFAQMKFERALETAFEECDQELLKHCAEKNDDSGACVAMCLLIHHEMFIANCGDSEVVLGRERRSRQDAFRAIPLTHKHTLKDPLEVERVQKLGGSVVRNRIYGYLAVSRALGDQGYKKPKCDENFVSSEPFVTSLTLTEDDHFVLISCDGLWERLGYQQAIDFVGNKLLNHVDVQTIADELVQLALEQGSLDNITVILIRLNWTAGAEYEFDQEETQA